MNHDELVSLAFGESTSGMDHSRALMREVIRDEPPHWLTRVRLAAKAEGLEEAADDFEAYWTSGAPVGVGPETWLRSRASRIREDAAEA